MREYDAEPKAVIAALQDRSMANKVLALSTLISFGMSTKTLSVVEMPTPKAASRQPRAKNGERGEALMKFMRSNKTAVVSTIVAATRIPRSTVQKWLAANCTQVAGGKWALKTK